MDTRRTVFEAFGEMLRTRREDMGLNQFQAGKLVGLSQPGYGEYELGNIKYTPPPDFLAKLGRAFGFTQLELLAALGYDVSPQIVANEEQQRIIRGTPMVAYLQIKYGVESPLAEQMASTYEMGLLNRAAIEEAKKNSSGRL